MPDAITAIRHDGRNLRADRTRYAIIDACRAMMRAGNFRPTIAAIAEASSVSIRSVFEHYGNIETVHWAALDVATTDAIVGIIVAAPARTADCVAHAAVFGRPMPPKPAAAE